VRIDRKKNIPPNLIQVLGVDIDSSLILKAWNWYGKDIPNLHFEAANIMKGFRLEDMRAEDGKDNAGEKGEKKTEKTEGGTGSPAPEISKKPTESESKKTPAAADEEKPSDAESLKASDQEKPSEGTPSVEDAEEKFDIVFAFSMTKWIHYQYHDTGMKFFFRKVLKKMKGEPLASSVDPPGNDDGDKGGKEVEKEVGKEKNDHADATKESDAPITSNTSNNDGSAPTTTSDTSNASNTSHSKPSYFVVEAQPWKSYKKKNWLTPEIKRVVSEIKFHPGSFPGFLEKQLGMKLIKKLGKADIGEGFDREVWVFRKG
jgi:hypothetical protein